MNRKPIVILVLGLVLLTSGGILSMSTGAPKAEAARAAQCRENMKDQAPDMLAKCDEKSFAIAMTATDANAAAQAISAANNPEVGTNTLSMFLLGLGGALTVASIFMLRKQAI
jgi:hypothetical protein